MRIWRVRPAEDGDDPEAEGEPRWTGTIVADFDQHKFVSSSFPRPYADSRFRSPVGRVEWNITGYARYGQVSLLDH